MAAPDYSRPRGQSSPGSPGLSGAVKDAVSATADAVTPRVVKDKYRQKVNDPQYDAQSTDSNNDYPRD